MRLFGSLLLIVLTLGFFIEAGPAAASDGARCGGVVFHDRSADGERDLTPSRSETDPELGVAGAQVVVTDATGARHTHRTDAEGRWSASADIVFPIRVDFEAPQGWAIAPAGADSGMASQFMPTADVCAEHNTGTVGVHIERNHCAENPQLVTSCFVVGSAENHDAMGAIVSVSNNAVDNQTTTARDASDWMTPLYEMVATVGEIGSVHGIAVAPDGSIYASAFFKRHARLTSSLNPAANPTAVFRIPPAGSPELFMVVDPGASSPRGDSGDESRYVEDLDSMDDVFTRGLGDLQLSADGTTLYTVDLGSRRLVAIDVASATVIEEVALDAPALGIDNCAATADNRFGDLRPFGLGLDSDGSILIGVVCSAASTVEDADFPVDRPAGGRGAGDETGLAGYVYDYGNRVFEQRLAWPLAGDRGRMQVGGGLEHEARWHPWVDVYPFDAEPPSMAYPQPAITDLVLTADGELVIALGDRWGHQTATFSPAPAWDGGVRVVEEPLAAGDLQRACTADRGWVIEGTSGCGGGLREAEHFGGDAYGIHEESGFGAVARVPGRAEVVASHANPVEGANTWRSGGLIWHEPRTGTDVRGVRLYDGREAQPDDTFEKATGIGGIAVDCGLAPVQLGGTVWHDANADGLRQPAETPIAGVEMALLDGSGDLVATTATDDRGAYLFGRSNATETLRAGDRYRVMIAAENYSAVGVFGRDGHFAGMHVAPVRTPGRTDNAASGPAGEAPVAETIAGDDPTTSQIESHVKHTLGFAMVDRYDLAIRADVAEADLAARTVDVALSVLNEGSERSGGLVIVDELGPGTSFVSVSPPTANVEHRGDIVEWVIDGDHDLAAGQSRTITLTLELDSELIEYANFAQLLWAEGLDADSEPGSVVVGSNAEARPDHASDAARPRSGEDDEYLLRIGVGEIGGRLWFDGDRSATMDPGESAVGAGIELYLTDVSGSVVSQTTTTAEGRYSFSMLLPGSYLVAVDLATVDASGRHEGWRFSEAHASRVVTVGDNAPTDEAFPSPSGTYDQVSDLTVDLAFGPPGSWSPIKSSLLAIAAGLVAVAMLHIVARRRFG